MGRAVPPAVGTNAKRCANWLLRNIRIRNRQSRNSHGRTAERIPVGYVVKDTPGQSLAYVYARKTPNDAQIANVLTEDEARRHRQQHRQATDATATQMSAPSYAA